MQVVINKTQETKTIDMAAMPEVSKEFIFNYGLRQILNDCHSSVQRKDFKTDDEFIAAVTAAVDKKLAGIMAGELTSRRAGSEPIDPVERETLRLIKDAIKAQITKQGKKAKEFDIPALAQTLLESSKAEPFRKQAKKNLAERAALSGELDIESMLSA